MGRVARIRGSFFAMSDATSRGLLSRATHGLWQHSARDHWRPSARSAPGPVAARWPPLRLLPPERRALDPLDGRAREAGGCGAAVRAARSRRSSSTDAHPEGRRGESGRRCVAHAGPPQRCVVPSRGRAGRARPGARAHPRGATCPLRRRLLAHPALPAVAHRPGEPAALKIGACRVCPRTMISRSPPSGIAAWRQRSRRTTRRSSRS